MKIAIKGEIMEWIRAIIVVKIMVTNKIPLEIALVPTVDLDYHMKGKSRALTRFVQGVE